MTKNQEKQLNFIANKKIALTRTLRSALRFFIEIFESFILKCIPVREKNAAPTNIPIQIVCAVSVRKSIQAF
jgi:hypothetical protein